MQNAKSLEFGSPTFWDRLKGMLGVDFYRLLHTPLFYIFLGIAAIIPAMVLGMTSMENAQGVVSPMYDNTWKVIAAEGPLYIVSSIAQYANMNMVFIFGGIMLAIFIGHDYKSGYVKQLFTSHPKKQDYMMSKTLVGAFSMVCMCGTYLLGTVLAGLFVGASFDVNVGSLICALLGKLVMSLGFASLFVFLNVIFRKKFAISIVMSFVMGTGILIIGAAGILGNSSILNIFLYGSAVSACLSCNFVTVLVCLVVSVVWSIIYNIAGTYILNKSDVY